MLTLNNLLNLPHYRQPVIIRKQDFASSKTVNHVPIYPTQKTIKRKDPNDITFSIEDFSNSEYSPLPSSKKERTTPFRKSSSLNFESKQTSYVPTICVNDDAVESSSTEHDDDTNESLDIDIPVGSCNNDRPSSQSEYPLVFNPSLISVSPRRRSGTEGAALASSTPAFLAQPAPKAFHFTPIRTSCSGDMYQNESCGINLSKCDDDNDKTIKLDNSNDKTIKLYH